MRDIRAFRTHTISSFFHQPESKYFFVYCLHSIIHSFLLLGFVFYQFFQPLFLNLSVWVFIYSMLFLSLLKDALYFFFHNKIKKSFHFFWFFLLLETLLMTLCLSVVLPVSQPILIFVYLLQIVGTGLVSQYRGAFLHALFISLLFSWVLILNSDEVGGSLLVNFAINNFIFLSVAGLSGLFGSQVRKMNWSLSMVNRAFDELENFSELVVEKMKMGLFIVNEDNFVIYANPSALKTLQLPPTFSAPLKSIFPDLDLHTSQQEGTHMNHFEFAYPSESSEQKIIEAFASPFTLTKGGSNKYLIFFQDCTTRHKREKSEREEERFAHIGKMATGIAHELRNPLSSISGSIQLMEWNEPLRSQNRKLMDIVLQEVSRLNKIIGDFMDYTSNESSLSRTEKLEVFSVNSVLESVLDQVRVTPQWEAITLHITLKAQGLIEGNLDRFKQIFLNVVKNACEAMKDSQKPNLKIETFDDDKWVTIKIKDNGTGIKNADFPYIYNPFYSRKSGGSGLGLAIARKFVLLYKGEIFLENHQPKGVVCTLRFPIHSTFSVRELAQRESA